MSDAVPQRGQTQTVLVWWLVFLGSQILGFFAVLALDPAGFDSCDQANAGPRPLQAAIAVAVVAAALVLAVARLRGWHLVAALAAVALSTLGWIWLLGPTAANC